MATVRDRGYEIIRKGSCLIFSTSRFSAEKESILHQGIYSKDFASALTSLALAGAVYAILALNLRRTVLYQAVFAVIFIGGYPLLRTFIFKDRILEAVFDLSKGAADISETGLLRKYKESVPLSAVEKLLIETKKIGVENPDAVEFIEKISAQHGTVIPGFGEEKLFFMLMLKLSDGSSRLIYADTNMQDVIDAHEEIQKFLRM